MKGARQAGGTARCRTDRTNNPWRKSGSHRERWGARPARRKGAVGRAAAVAAGLILALVATPVAGQDDAARIYNTAKQKLMNGEGIVGVSISSPDPESYCAAANAGFDFTWIEMQHSPLTYQDVARMLWACRDASAIPFIRVPDATEGDIQKAVDLGALGIVVPMVRTAEKMERAVRFAKFPPEGRRSLGGGQYGALWGRDYRATANENILIVAMIESPAGVEAVEEIAAVPGVDVVFAASTDLYSFSGRRQGEPEYEAMVDRIRDAVLGAGLKLGGPLAWRDREGFSFFQAPGVGTLIRRGAQALLEETASGIAEIEGSEEQ